VKTCALPISDGGDVAGVLEAIKELTRLYEVDPHAMTADALVVAATAEVTKEGHQLLASEALAALERAVDADDYKAASRLLDLAEKSAKAGGVAPLGKRIVDRRRDLLIQQKEYDLVKPALAKRKLNPDDPEANLAA